MIGKDFKNSRSSELKAQFGEEDEDEELRKVEEESRLKVLTARRESIRGALKSAESLRNFRLQNGFVPELDENGEPLQSDSKFALSLTAFVVAAGAVTLRIGGRAALVSAVGLDFANDNPELKDGLDTFLNYAQSLDPTTEAAIFILAWTVVKVFCVDFGGIILALSSGVLFGGVLQGAAFSALAATIGSSVAFGLAKLDTPLRQKALDIVEDNPSLRGIEKVVAEDGLKAILTLRLAPIIPIPLGMYNYVYGVTNVPYLDFAGGIFLGSLKPYLLDSYLGFFGKQVIDGSLGGESSTQDIILLAALGFSVLIGVFASQLASETWESVKKEVEAEQLEKLANVNDNESDGITRKIMGMNLPQWAVGFQLSLKESEERVNEYIDIEYQAAVWNFTDTDEIPKELNPAKYPNSPEIVNANTGFDVAAWFCDGLVLSPCLLSAFLTYADPLMNREDELQKIEKRFTIKQSSKNAKNIADKTNMNNKESLQTFETTYNAVDGTSSFTSSVTTDSSSDSSMFANNQPTNEYYYDKKEILEILSKMKVATQETLDSLNEEMEKKQ